MSPVNVARSSAPEAASRVRRVKLHLSEGSSTGERGPGCRCAAPHGPGVCGGDEAPWCGLVKVWLGQGIPGHGTDMPTAILRVEVTTVQTCQALGRDSATPRTVPSQASAACGCPGCREISCPVEPGRHSCSGCPGFMRASWTPAARTLIALLVLAASPALACPNLCNQQGLCVRSKCECFPGYGGLDCSKRELCKPVTLASARAFLCAA